MLTSMYEHLENSRLPESLKGNSLAIALRSELVEDSRNDEFRSEYKLLLQVESGDLIQRARELYPSKSDDEIEFLLKEVEKYLADYGKTRNSKGETVEITFGDESRDVATHLEEVQKTSSSSDWRSISLLMELVDFASFDRELGERFTCSKLGLSLSRYPELTNSESDAQPFLAPLIVHAVIDRKV